MGVSYVRERNDSYRIARPIWLGKKSTIARSVRSAQVNPMALIEQDYLRRIVLKEKDLPGGVNIQIIEKMVLFALDHSFDVIMEGIFDAERYGLMFEELLRRHPHNNYFFYFNVSFEETLRRHQTKPNKDDFGEAEMRRWYKSRDLLQCTSEIIIPQTSSFKESVNFIIATCKLASKF